MIRWLIKVTYQLGGIEFSEAHYVKNKSRCQAINEVEQNWHEVNLHLFSEHVEFAIEEVELYD